MKRNILVASITVALLALIGALAATAFSQGEGRTSTPPGLAEFSSAGTPVTVSAEAQQRLADIEKGGQIGSVQQVSFLAALAGRAFYRMSTTSGIDCYSLTSASANSSTVATSLDAITCPIPSTDGSGGVPFPSANHPLLDESLFTQTATSPPSFVRVEGFAADGVSKIAVLDPQGNIVGTTSVVNNVYEFSSLPSGRITGLTALDASGTEVYTETIPGS